MNTWQLAQQIKHELATVRWEAGSKALVFGAQSVYLFAGSTPSPDDLPPGFPFALVMIGAATTDPDAPDLLQQTFTIATAVEVAGDPLGEFAVIGSARGDLGASAGAGCLEVSERVRAAVQALTGADGASLILSGSGAAAPAVLGNGRHVASEEFTVTAWCTSQPYYAAPQRAAVVGNVMSWHGDHCSARFDFLRYRVGYVAGDTPAATPDECVGIVYTGTNREFAATFAAGRTYSVFADYSPRGTGTVAGSSRGDVVGSFVAV